MASTYTSSIRIEKPGIGENDNTWGTILNTGFDLLSDSIAGLTSVSVSTGSHYLTFANGATDTSRKHIVVVNGAAAGAFSVISPAVPKTYLVQNNATGGQTMTFTCSAGTGVTIPSSTAMYVYCDGTSVRAASTPVNYAGSPVYTSVAASVGLFNGLVATSASIGTVHITGALVVDGATTLGVITATGLSSDTVYTSTINATTVSASAGTINILRATDLTVTGTATCSTINSTAVNTSTLSAATATLGIVTATRATNPVLNVATSTTVTLDLSLSNNFYIGPLDKNIKLANPTNQVAGQAGMILVPQNVSGGYTITYGTDWRFEGGTDPTNSTASYARDVLSYFVLQSGEIFATLGKAFA